MKILIISAEVWQSQNNGGNILTTLFSGASHEFAQIYCNPGLPDNDICNNYLQLTDKSCLRSFFRGSDPFIRTTTSEKAFVAEDSFKKKFSLLKTPFFYFSRDCLFYYSKWKKSPSLTSFLDDFKPDLIFAPSYASFFMLRLDLWIANYCKAPVVGYVSDDNYSLRQFSLSPFFWVNRFLIRRATRKLYREMDQLFTMTSTQANELKKSFCSLPIVVLRKEPANVSSLHSDYNNKCPRIIYAGGVYLNRFKTIINVQRELTKTFGPGVHIDIFTGSKSRRQIRKLVKAGCRCYQPLPFAQLTKKYQEYDIALHAESFDKKNRMRTRLSFSTKIMDCLSSGCATLAYCPNNNAGFLFLKENGLAFCASSKTELRTILKEVITDNCSLRNMAKKSTAFCEESQRGNFGKRLFESSIEEIVLGRKE